VRDRRSFQQLFVAEDEPLRGGADTIRKAVVRVATKMGMSTKGWTGWT
jgi:hypothetical protein